MNKTQNDYWTKTDEQLFRELRTTTHGLTHSEAEKRLLEHGRNLAFERKKRSRLDVLAAQFTSPLIWILIVAAVIALALDDAVNAGIIITIVALNTLLAYSQEYKSERALEELQEFLAPTCHVVRGNETIEIDARNLVPGDIVSLKNGDLIPADLRLFSVTSFSTNESTLTGESMPVPKNTEAIRATRPIPQDLYNTAFMGTSVASGKALGIVVATGKDTEFGRIAKLVEKPYDSEFKRNITRFGGLLLKITVLLTVFIFAANALLGRDVFQSLLFALALAVGITPEVLPTIITLNLSRGAVRLSKKKVVVRKLDSIEDLGNIDVLCTDKTGTLTENAIILEQSLDATGKPTEEILEAGLLCNAISREESRHHQVQGIDEAIWHHARTQGYNDSSLRAWKKIVEIPFDFERRRLSVVVERAASRKMIVKGAPENILPLCNALGRKKIEERVAGWENEGLRVIAIAQKSVTKKNNYSIADEKGLELLGFFTFQDPPKKGMRAALDSFKKLKVDLVVLTGDSPRITQAVCQEVGLEIRDRIYTGEEIESYDDDYLSRILDRANVFARVSPEQKLRVVNAFVSKGKVVGFLGDGANDAPALKAADVGISVREAVGVAREAADMVLLNKSLHVIADGIEEGRVTFQNTTKYVDYTVSANFGNIISIAISSLFLPFFPLLPAQVLLTNLVTDGPTIAISSDNVDKDALRRPRHWNFDFIVRFMIFFGLVSTVFDLVTIFLLSNVLRVEAVLFRTAWFLESVLSEIVILYSLRTRKPFYQSHPSNMLVIASIATVALTFFILTYPPIASAFQFVPMPTWLLATILAIVGVYFAASELLKPVFYARYPPE
ncbi:MAG TPA: magnesium-translocating P-type ATPase [Candidatus Norongarragalinales archaeon]|jgi:Mg2+-importing ATPase|nr:magnesium-translocating P-type ATPase [Candidatus Norongarragalinales archaeon]